MVIHFQPLELCPRNDSFYGLKSTMPWNSQLDWITTNHFHTCITCLTC